jgi:predicted PurR-regulated permease PerM
MAKSSVAPASQATLAVLVGTVISVTVIGGLYWAQTVLVPVALAVFLAFPLAPLVTALQRRRMGRIPSVILVVMLATLVLGGVLWIVKVELTGLANDLPTYTENIQGKVKYLRQMGHGAGMERLGKMAEDISGEWEKTLANIKGASKVPSEGASPAPPEKSPTAVIPPENTGSAAPARPQVPAWLSWLPSFLNPVMASLASLALTLVLVVFMLLEREALRNRLIRLVGDGHMTTATKALDDAGSRISRYLLMQLAVNGIFSS